MELFQFASDDSDEVFVRAEEHLAETGALPAIDRSLWSFDVQQAFDLSPRIEWPGPDALLGSLPSHDKTNPLHRASIANLIFQVCDSGGRYEEERAEWFYEFVPALRRYLSYRDPVTVDDIVVLRWELHAAAAARDIERLLRLAAQWQSLDGAGEHYAVVIRTLFAAAQHCEWPAADASFTFSATLDNGSVHDGFAIGQTIRQSWATFIPLDDEPFGQPVESRHSSWNSFLFASRTQGLDSWSFLPASQAAGLRVQAVRHCSSFLQLLGAAGVDAAPDLGLIEAWCVYALSRLDGKAEQLSQAAKRYLEWTDKQKGADETIIAGAFEAATRCYTLAGRLGEAEASIRAWVRFDPESAMAYRKLSEVLWKQDRPLEAREAFETFIRLGAESKDDEWANSLLLRLGLEAADKHRVGRAIEAAANTASWRQPGLALLAWVAPWTQKLTTLAANRWWVGLYTLSMPSHRDDIGEAEVWSQAAAAFGSAVEFELRATVFGELKHWPTPSQGERAQLPDPWKTIYQDRATLGQLLDALLMGPRPNNVGARSLHELLRARRPHLLNFLRVKSPEQLKRIAVGRNLGQHGGGATAQHAHAVFDEASKLLEVLHRDVT